VDRHRRKKAGDRLEADQQRDHREDDGARESGEIAELACAEGETRIIGEFTRIGVGERREQEIARMSAHVQSICDERNRAEQE
jgi:hypothetical protein